MPASIAPVAGADITALGVGNIRKDAIIRTETVVAGETIAAYTTTGSITFPTVVVLSGTKWYKSNADGVVPGLGWVQSVALAMTAAGGDGSTFTIVKPGSQITSELFPSMAGITAGLNLFPSATVPGGVAAYDGNTMKSYRLLAFADTTTSVDFTPTHNSTLLQANQSIFTADEAVTRYDIVYINTSGRAAKTNSSTPFGAGYADAIAIANSAASGAGQPLLCAKIGAIMPVNPGGFTVGQPVFTSDTPGHGSSLRGRFSRQIGVAIDASNVYICPLEPNRNMIIEVVLADEAWSVGDFLYRKSSNGRAAKSDADLVEPGIAEVPYIALTTHASVGSLQPVACQGSILHSIITGTAGTQLWNSTTAGARSTTFPGHDFYTRKYGYFIDTDRFLFQPEPSRFMPPGEQEKGFCAAGSRNDTADADTAADRVDNGVNFNKVMANLPSSITLTVNTTFGSPTATAPDVTRYGFRLRVENSGSGIYYWTGFFTTVGN